jgi:hypothetical protein
MTGKPDVSRSPYRSVPRTLMPPGEIMRTLRAKSAKGEESGPRASQQRGNYGPGSSRTRKASLFTQCLSGNV